MTYAVVPALRHAAGARRSTGCREITSTEYDPRVLPAAQKTGCTIGMGMTEKQGGSDVRANTTRAHAPGRRQLRDRRPQVVLLGADVRCLPGAGARPTGGLTCFLLPRCGPTARATQIRIQRLKDKLGDWSNASSEVEFHGACAQRVGDEGRGVATILEMVALTRLDCMIGSSCADAPGARAGDPSLRAIARRSASGWSSSR